MTSRRPGFTPARQAPWTVTVPLLLSVLLPAALLDPARATAGGDAERQTVAIATSTTLGTYLTDGHGNTLYFSTADLPGVSNCTGGCISVWPPFIARSVSVTPPLEAADFGYIVRAKGRRQVTYQGRPLYEYSRDWAPHDTNGQGLYGTWYVVRPDLPGPPSN